MSSKTRPDPPQDSKANGDELMPPASSPAQNDLTLGGYFTVHSRPPAFEGCDGQAYTVSIEVEQLADLRSPVGGYLVFPCWAKTGLGIVGHVETSLLWKGQSREAVVEKAEKMSLHEVQQALNDAIVQKAPPTDRSR